MQCCKDTIISQNTQTGREGGWATAPKVYIPQSGLCNISSLSDAYLWCTKPNIFRATFEENASEMGNRQADKYKHSAKTKNVRLLRWKVLYQ